MGTEDLQESAQLDWLNGCNWSNLGDSLDLLSEFERSSACLLEHMSLNFSFKRVTSHSDRLIPSLEHIKLFLVLPSGLGRP